MRLRFGDAKDERRRSLIQQADGFFSRARELLPWDAGVLRDGDERARLERSLGRELESVSAGLGVEIDARGDDARVLLFPRDDDGLAPLVDAVLDRAPSTSRVTFARHRPALDPKEAVSDVHARTGFDFAHARARMGFSRGHLLETVVYAPAFTTAVDEALLAGADLLVRRLLGDERFDDWVSAVDIAPLPRGGPLRVVTDGALSTEDTLALPEVLPAAESAIRGAVDGLSDVPYHVFCERAEWTLFELTPERHADYPPFDDLVLLSTMLPEAMKSFLEGARFSSHRFSRHGERFAYLRIDAPELTADERFSLRAQLEDALNFVLVPGRLGCVVAAGVGLRYVYLVLALERVDDGLDVALRRLRKFGVARRSWIQFCDAEWSREWIGVWDETPEPDPA